MPWPKKPEDPIEEFIAWQDSRHSHRWLPQWGVPSFLRFKRPAWWPYSLLILGAAILVVAVMVGRQVVASAPLRPASLLAPGLLGLLAGLFLYGGMSWLIVGRKGESAARKGRRSRPSQGGR